jgi:hypothetical protein
VKYHIPKKNVGIKNPAWCKNDAAKLFIDFQYKLEYKKKQRQNKTVCLHKVCIRKQTARRTSTYLREGKYMNAALEHMMKL